MFAAAGLSEKDVRGTVCKSMVQLAGDMASFHDQDPTEMLVALRSGLAGEAEPLRTLRGADDGGAVKQFAVPAGDREDRRGR